MKESKILLFNSNAYRPTKTAGTGVTFTDYPEAEQVIDGYLAQGWSISEFSAMDAMRFFVVLTR